MTSLLSWADAFEAGPSICGGKGYNLARLARYGFRVPRGGVLPVGASISEIECGLRQLGLDDASVAVRSSATAEDSARASFAGIHRSYLNVLGVEAVKRAAQDCIDSLETPEAQSYRRRMGIADEDVRCALVICEMVNALCAGVAFSCDPASGRRDLILIDAAEGLGDRLVQGTVNPVRMVWRRSCHQLLRESAPLPNGLLPPQREEELAHLVDRIQWALGEGANPQDIEWAYDGERIWILQARPVTALPRAGWPETASLPCYWSTANLKDNLPGVPGELSWSSLCNSVPLALYASQRAAGYEIPPGIEIVRRFHGRAYFDLTAMQWAFYDAFGIAPAETVNAIGGSQPVIPVPPDPLAGPKGRRRRLAGLRLLPRLWASRGTGREALKLALAYARRLRSIDWTLASRDDLRVALEQIGELQLHRLDVAGIANIGAGPWRLALDALVRDGSLVARLQAGAGGVATAETGYRLNDVAEGNASLDEFLDEFGHHAVHEAEFLNPRWAEDPSWILEQLEIMRANPQKGRTRDGAAAIRLQAKQELKQRFGWRAPFLLWLVRRLCVATAEREAAKSALVCLMLPMRRIVLEIGRRLAAEGKLDAPEQALHFAFIDVNCWLGGYWNGEGARDLAADRIARRESWLAEAAPDLITEEPDGRIAASAQSAPAVPGSEWVGLGVSPGRAAGIARILRDPAASGSLQFGDVLVAPCTDPGWTPLLQRAAAIVVETGGFLSHGSIVAREFGIPAVANVPGILAVLRDGERIEVDGSTGRIVRLNSSDSPDRPTPATAALTPEG
ncbi:MAG TPA: PEP/pyruvate-binding domain-containing protein [Terracidiphilus sp.]|nr:PEP/pyruvate-binding domain-containing protein [Terracidiphilus sp.]